MGELPNIRHERFCQALVRGESANRAYQTAGYKGGSTANAARLKATEAIKRRIAELSAEAAKAHEISIASVCKELDEAIALAKTKGQPNALVSAATLRSRLGGLLIDKAEVEVNGGNRNEWAELSDFPAAARAFAASQLNDLVNARWLPIDESDHAYLAEMWLEHFARVKEFLLSVEARPLIKEGMRLLTERDVRPNSK
jgi:hypothetical protein